MQSYKQYRWIVTDPDLLAGQLAVRGTRLSVAFLLNCLAEGMGLEEIHEAYGSFPDQAIPEILHVAAEFLELPVQLLER
jgi:uncharacterized protein (DUF433 family)